MTTDSSITRREREVWEACDELWEKLQKEGQGLEKLTGELIKEKLIDLGYKRGNPSQVYQYRTTWMTQNGHQLEAGAIEWPSLTDPIARAVAKVRDEIQLEAQTKIETIQKESFEKIAELETQLQLKIIAFNEKNERHQELNQECQELRTNFQHSIEELQQVRGVLQLEKNRANGLEEHQKILIQQHEKALKILRDSETQSEKVHQQRSNELQQSHRHDIDVLKTMLENQRQTFVSKIENLKEEQQKQEIKLQKELQKQEELKLRAQNAQSDLKQLQEQHRLSRTELETMVFEKQNLQRQNDIYQGQIKSLQCQIEATNTEMQNHHHKRLADQEELGRLKQKLEHIEQVSNKSTLTKAERFKNR